MSMMNNVDYFVQFDLSYDATLLATTIATFTLHRTFLINHFQNYSRWLAWLNEERLVS